MSLREDILDCERCFGCGPNDARGCHHHEDLVGGYDRARILFVGVNPQAGSDSEFYKRVQDADPEQKMLLGDNLWRIFGGNTPPQALSSELYMNHPGKGWVKQLTSCLGLHDVGELANHVRGVELYKHATPGIEQLRENDAIWTRIQQECPKWLVKQVEALAPNLVILSGGLGLKYARSQLRLSAFPESITEAHGRTCTGRIGTWEGEILTTLAVSKRTMGLWNKLLAAKAAIGQAVRRAIASGNATPVSLESDTRVDLPRGLAHPTTEDALFLVESRHEAILWNGVWSSGTRAAGYRYARYLHLLQLSRKVVEMIATADWQGRRGRKYGPLRSDDAPFAVHPEKPDAWYFSKCSNAYFPNVYPRARSRLENGRPVPLSPDEIEALF